MLGDLKKDRPQKIKSRRASSNWVVGGSAADCDPAELGEFFEGGFAAEPAVAAVFYAAEGHLWLVVNRGAVDVADAGLHLLGEAHGFVDVAAEDGAGEAVFGVVGDAQGFFVGIGDYDRHDWAERFLAVDSHFRCDAKK